MGSGLGIPFSGWNHGQSRLFEHGDIRLIWLLRRLAVRTVAERTAANLARAGQVAAGDVMLTAVTAARENSSSLADVSMMPIGLPRSVTDAWRHRAFISSETGHQVQPAIIPARDQVLAYAAQLRASYVHNFQKHLNTVLGSAAGPSLAQASRVAALVWKAYSFLAPGGADYDPKKSVSAQSGQPFGSRSALLFLQHRAVANGIEVDLDDILTAPDLNHVEWIRSAKVRVAEALFLERMWTVTRELLPPSEF